MRERLLVWVRLVLRRWPGPIVVAVAVTAMLLPVACQNRAPSSTPAPTPAPAASAARPADAPAPPAATPAPPTVSPQRPPPSLTVEPTIGVYLQGGQRVDFTLLVAGRIGAATLAPGSYSVQATTAGLSLGGVPCPSDCVIELADAAGAPRFQAELTPPFGKPQRLSFCGCPWLHLDRSGRVELIERVAMETYLAGVLPTEMIPSWPVEALKAQAVAARSYACAHVLDRADQAWQLHWHYSVDMAYGGCPAKAHPAVRQALDQTRGWILDFRGQPVPALFHACSGGRTESAANLWPGMRSATGVLMTAAMPVVDDPAAQGGAAGLKMIDSHWLWKANVPLADITAGLAEWTRDHPEARLQTGTVLEIKPGARFADSGRVATVSIRQRIGRKESTITMPAQDFRMAAGPGVIRSTWWDRCTTAAAKGGTLVVSGHGFGHGVGLSQVSAWRMAKDGATAERILALFYPGCSMRRSWP